jgi:pimeloyl-ACP methyl ester carboxylesterase
VTDANLFAGASSVMAESVFISASDGLRLHVRAYRPAAAKGLPVVCLPGLARTEADFEPLAHYLASDANHPRSVFALDYRGRGQSAYDSDWRNYNLAVELADVVTVLSALGIRRAVFIGTSRGGLLTMLLAATQGALIAGAILNDIGPVIEPKGLLRIRGYIGKMPAPRDYAEGAGALRGLFGAQFPALSDDDWLAWSKRSWAQHLTASSRATTLLLLIRCATLIPSSQLRIYGLRSMPWRQCRLW